MLQLKLTQKQIDMIGYALMSYYKAVLPEDRKRTKVQIIDTMKQLNPDITYILRE